MPQFYSDLLDEDLRYERCESFGGGMDAFTRSTLLPPDAFQYAENILIPDNLEARTRPGADRIATNLAQKIQGLIYYDTPAAKQLLTAAGGALKYTDASLAAWTAMAAFALTDGDLLFSAAQGVDKLLITDGTKFLQWDGANLTNFTTNPNDPPGGASIVLWHAGRMWAAGFPGTGAAGKEDDAVCVSSVLNFGNAGWDLTDRSFRVGKGEGDPILGLCSIPATVPEQVVLGVLKRNSIHLIRTDPTVEPAKYSEAMNPDLVSPGLGIVGKRAFCVHGNDLYFVAPDKSFRQISKMEAAAQQYQVGGPMSVPLQPYIDRINWTFASTIAVTGYRQLVFFAVPLDVAQSPNTVFVYSIRLQRWVGVFTGWTPNCFEVTRFNGVQRLMHGDSLGNVRQWKDYADNTDDATYLDDGAAIASKFYPRANLFQEPLNDKDLYHYEARFGQSNAVVTFTLIGDGATLKTWTADLRPQGPNLEIDLEFDLTNPTNTPARKGLRGLPPCNESYVKVESAAGWWSLKSISTSAFTNTLASQ